MEQDDAQVSPEQPGDFNGDNEKEDITRHVVDACRIINAKTRKKYM